MDTVTGILTSAREGLAQSVALNNGVRMPWLGLGVYEMESDAATERIAREAIDMGYRAIDTAALYGNERGVGQAALRCGLPREQVFVTSKVWNDDMRRGRVAEAFEESMRRLGLEYVDLYLLHWPIEGKIAESWKALERLQRDGRIRAIGVSNFLPRHLDELLAAAEIVPAVNQIEYHPYLQSRDIKARCEKEGIRVEAWSPFMHGGTILTDPTLRRIGERYGKSPAQVILRWILQTGVATIPKTIRPARLAENASIFDFELSAEDMAAIAALDRGQRWGADPENFDF